MFKSILEEQISYYEDSVKSLYVSLDNIIETSEFALSANPSSQELKLAIKQLKNARKLLDKINYT